MGEIMQCFCEIYLNCWNYVYIFLYVCNLIKRYNQFYDSGGDFLNRYCDFWDLVGVRFYFFYLMIIR